MQSKRTTSTEELQARLRSLDLRIARMRELHASSTDPMAARLIQHSLAERAEVLKELAL